MPPDLLYATVKSSSEYMILILKECAFKVTLLAGMVLHLQPVLDGEAGPLKT